ncbi:hypothetical protein VTI74DRAFT_8695 [Chaetomium olivicolor]
MSTSPPTPPLLRVPGEIRNQIYQSLVVFLEPVHIYRESYRNNGNNEPPLQHSVSSFSLTSLFLTCRQIHAEASAMFYSQNIFALPTITSQAPHQIQANFLFRWFLDRVGPHNAARIRHLAVPFPVEPSALIHSHLSAASSLPPPSSATRIFGTTDEGGCYQQLIPALQRRCPNLESISFDLRWNNHWVRLLTPHTTTVQTMFGRLDEVLKETFPRLKRVTLSLSGPGRNWTFTSQEVQTAVEMHEEEFECVRQAIEEGQGWTITVSDGEETPVTSAEESTADEEEDEEEEEEEEEEEQEPSHPPPQPQQQHNSAWSSMWYAPEGRQPTAHLWEAPEMAIESEMHDQWTRVDELKFRARYALAWLRSPRRAVQARADAEEWSEWKRTMIAQAGPVGVPLYCLASSNSSIPPRVPRTARVRRSVRNLLF